MSQSENSPKHSSQDQEIKWRLLKRIAEKICGKTVNIHGTTTLHKDIRAATDMGDIEVNIAINLNKVKSDTMVISAIAHELTHIVLDDYHHPEEFQEKWRSIESEIRLFYEGGTLDDNA